MHSDSQKGEGLAMKVAAVVDYQGRLLSKWAARPYRSGLDRTAFAAEMRRNGADVDYVSYVDICDPSCANAYDFIVLTSSEDSGLHYKSYIEDVALHLDRLGLTTFPRFELLRAHHNKVFMELTRSRLLPDSARKVGSVVFGTAEDALNHRDGLGTGTWVLKASAGASSLGVHKIEGDVDLNRLVRKVSSSRDPAYDLRDVARAIRHRGYRRESLNRRKFVIQKFIAGMDGDWKVLVFGDKYFVLKRSCRPNDFRASGSGLLRYPDEVPSGLLGVARSIYEALESPCLGMDVGFDGKDYVLIEFQAVNFGTHTADTAPFYYACNESGVWEQHAWKGTTEGLFADSLVGFFRSRRR